MAEVDAHVIQLHEYDDAPELEESFFEKAAYHIAGVEVEPDVWWAERRAAERAQLLEALRLDADVLEHFKAAGPDWRAQINAALRAAMEKAS